MNDDELRTAISTIRDAQVGVVSARLSGWIGSDWLWDLFSRAVMLTGGDTPLFSDVDLRDEDGPVGAIVVVTEKSLVRVAFRDPVQDGWEFRVTVVAERVPISAIQKVAVDAVEGSRREDAPWPLRAKLTLHLDREVAGVSSVTLPQDDVAYGERAQGLAVLLRSLL